MNPWSLTPREQEVMALICRVGAMKLVAKEMGISYRTVELHMTHIKEKMAMPHMALAALAWDRYVFARSAKHDSAEYSAKRE